MQQSTLGFLPGFSPKERKPLDRKGFIQNNSRHVFQTFEDWGPDEMQTSR